MECCLNLRATWHLRHLSSALVVPRSQKHNYICCAHNLRHAESRRIAQPPSGILGSHDAVPPGFQPPGYGGLQEPFPGGMGRTGGMHMGPDDPLFAGRSGMGRSGRPGLNPPGARYDPIGPPGMPVNPSTHLVQPWWESSMITCVAMPAL